MRKIWLLQRDRTRDLDPAEETQFFSLCFHVYRNIPISFILLVLYEKNSFLPLHERLVGSWFSPFPAAPSGCTS